MVGSYINPSKSSTAMSYIASRRDRSGIQPIDPIEHYLDGVAVHGTPERVLDQLQRLREEMFLDYLLCAPLSHSSFMMFTEKVLPRLL